MCTIYIMRHADKPHEWKGFDCPISTIGRQTAQNVIGETQIAIISPLIRTKQTLEFSRIKVTDKVIETNLCREHMANNPSDYLPTDLINGQLPIESPTQLKTRINAFHNMLKDLSKKHTSILVITHGVFMTHLLNLKRYVEYCESFPYTQHIKQ